MSNSGSGRQQAKNSVKGGAAMQGTDRRLVPETRAQGNKDSGPHEHEHEHKHGREGGSVPKP